MKLFSSILFLTFALFSCIVNNDSKKNKKKSDFLEVNDSSNLAKTNLLGEEYIIINDFRIFVFKENKANREFHQMISVLKDKLTELSSLVPEKQLKKLKKVPICVEYKLNKESAMWYHKSKEWLIEHGYPPELAKCVEICNIKNFLSWQKLNQPYMVLHELAHAYHDRELGSDNAEILHAYESALSSQIYEEVEYNLGGKKRAYAMNNADEYFAEITEAYFGLNDYFPYNKSQLKDFDPIGYELMIKTWGLN